MSTVECPSPELLRSVLKGGLSGPRRDEVLRHAETCPACRAALGLGGDQTRTESPGSDPRVGHLTEAEPIASAELSPTLPEVPVGPPALPYLDPPTRRGTMGRLGEY